VRAGSDPAFFDYVLVPTIMLFPQLFGLRHPLMSSLNLATSAFAGVAHALYKTSVNSMSIDDDVYRG
jgi:hypothetical protein